MALLVLLGASAQALAQTPAQTRPQDQLPAWELKSGGRWQPATGPAAPAIADETLDRVEEMIQNRQGDAARKIVVAWLRINKQSPIRDRGVYLLGQANFIAHNRINAFYNFDELLDFYPDSKYYYPSLERQYDIADQFLKGYKRRFLGMPFFDAKIEATEMLYRIQGRSPGSPLAEKALLRVADHYYAEGEFDVAADAYAAYVKGYPRSPYLPRVRLRQAFSALAQFRGIKFEATPIIDARQQLLDLSAMYPKIAEEENVAAIIARIDVALARKLLETANF
jgi:outer membrane protein assembly factor BamD (BamD/ComL family)